MSTNNIIKFKMNDKVRKERRLIIGIGLFIAFGMSSCIIVMIYCGIKIILDLL